MSVVGEQQEPSGKNHTNGAHTSVDSGPRHVDRTRFPLEIFPPEIQRYVRTVAASTETPVDAVAFAVLGMLSACYGTHVRVLNFEGYTTWCNEYCTLVGGSSLGKTPIFKHVQVPLRNIERTLQDEKAEEVALARARIARLEADRNQVVKAYKAGSGAEAFEAEINDIDEEIEALQAVTLPQVIVSDVTPEVLVKIQSQNGGAASMVSGETPFWSKLSGRASGKPPDLEPFLSGYDGEFYRVDRITRESNFVDEARLAILGGTQDAVLQDVHSRPEILDRGLLARFLFYKAEPLLESDPNDFETPVGPDVRRPYEETLEALGLRFRRTSHEPFSMDPSAKTLYRTWRNLFKREHRLMNGRLHDMAAFARKLENKVLRWAGLLHPLWNATPGTLTQADFERALLLVDFAIDHFRAIDALVVEGPVASLARSIAGWLRGKQGQVITLRNLRRLKADYRRATEEVREAALEELEADGVVRREKQATKGRPSPVLVVL